MHFISVSSPVWVFDSALKRWQNWIW